VVVLKKDKARLFTLGQPLVYGGAVECIKVSIGTFSVLGFLLVTRSEYSQSLASYWSHVRNILSPWLPIG
jgi:hypothetical protein